MLKRMKAMIAHQNEHDRNIVSQSIDNGFARMNVVNKFLAGAELPINTVDLASQFGLKVYYVKGWDNTISGLIKRDSEFGGDSGYAIFVNKSHPPVRRRFTIAHEIAHFVLHKSEIDDEDIVDDGLYRSGLSNEIEKQANEYAAQILMPQNLINKYFEELGGNVDQLAQKFWVSKLAMTIRLNLPPDTLEV